MPSFFALNIAVGALRANQYAMDVTAHNIANAATEGYHRQDAVFRAARVLRGVASVTGIGVPQLGTGVDVQTVRRAQTDHIDGQVRLVNQWLGMWRYRDESLKQVEAVLSEPGSLGLSDGISKFWNAWDDLSTTPESLPARVSVVQSGVALSQRIRTLYRDIRDLQANADRSIVDNAKQINKLAREIAQFNEEIRRYTDPDNLPNDLIDQRDQLLDELSKIARIETAGGTSADLIVSIGGKSIVQGGLANEIIVTEGANGWSDLVWADDGSSVNITGGELAGQVQIRDKTLQDYIDSLNTIASALVDKVNELHSSGTTIDGNPAGNFFVADTDASNIAVEAALINDASGVAASTSGKPGENDLAKKISDLRNQNLIGNKSILDAYSELVGNIGAHSREADSRATTYTLTLQQLKTQRDSVAGVSVDEEMANMVRFQQSYNAAARIFNVIDEMIDTVVNRLGASGR